MLDEEREEIRVRFQQYYHHKILVYGSGKAAEKIVNALYDFDIVGVVDRNRFYGNFSGLPFLLWDEVCENTADVLIIAAAQKNYEIIYRRIQDKCRVCQLIVLGTLAERLDIYFGGIINRLDIMQYCSKNIEELKEKINRYDAISFDIFDTLVMRKVLEPWDLFDIVEMRLKKRGIFILDFKKCRREADRLSKGGNINQIYDILQKMLNISCMDREIILNEELKCEREFLMPRRVMVDIMNYAYSLGKRISLISDMYIPKTILEDMLKEKGITKFHDLYVSCDYGTTKGEHLYEIYKKKIAELKCLHIGDNSYSDGEKPRQYEIDTYEICSAYEMLSLSELHGVLGYANNINERNMIGLLISDIFNNPFALYGTFGVVQIKEYKSIGKIFLAPLVMEYIENLANYLKEHGEYDGILFAARDGYLLQKIYKRYREQYADDKSLAPAFYFLTSRKLALRASAKSDRIEELLKSYLSRGSAEWILTNIIGIQIPMDRRENEQDKEYIERHKKAIIRQSEETRKNYFAYMNKNKISIIGKYLFCEMESRGTTQYALNQMFVSPLTGFYMSRSEFVDGWDILVHSIAANNKYSLEMSAIIGKQYFQEMFLTDLVPSIQDMDIDGNPIYDEEKRSKEELSAIEQVQTGIYEFLDEYMDKLYNREYNLCKELPEILYRYFDKVVYMDECENIYKFCVYDSLFNGKYDLFSNEKIRK